MLCCWQRKIRYLVSLWDASLPARPHSDTGVMLWRGEQGL